MQHNLQHNTFGQTFNMGTIRFALRTNKPMKDQRCMVELIYQISRVRRFYNTGLKSFKETWNQDEQSFVYLNKQQAKKLLPDVEYIKIPTQDEVKEFNGKLIKLRSQVEDIEKRFELDKARYSAADVVTTLKSIYDTSKKEARQIDLFGFIDTYLTDHATTRVKGSLSVYKALKTHLKAFEDHKRSKVTFDSINYSFFEAFQNFLLTLTKVDKQGNKSKALNNTTIAKQLSTIKTFLNYAKLRGINVSDSYKKFKIKRQQLEVIALTNEEFETLYNYDLSNNKRLRQVRDVFCFACVTGLRFSDLFQLKREHIKEGVITLTSKKTHVINSLPLNRYAKEILSRYKEQLRPLPVISNQKTNDFLKELCKEAGISELIEVVRYRGVVREAITYPKHELIGVHTGRKTFVTLSLEKGMSAEVIMTITGHKDYASFKRYVNVTEQRKKNAMVAAWDEGSKPRGKLKAV